MREAVAGDQISAVFSTHVVAELEQVADYLIVLGRGAVLLSGPTAELTAAHGGQSPEQVILSALRENSCREPSSGGGVMTAAAIPGRRERAAARPVPWTRLTWVAWRQHRAALAGAAALLGAIAVYLAYPGWEIHRAYDSFNACLPASLRGLPLAGRVRARRAPAGRCSGLHVLLRHRDGALCWPPVLTRRWSRSCCWPSRCWSAPSPAGRCWPANWSQARSASRGRRARAGCAWLPPGWCRSRPS